jgi:hypothetical protein
VYSKYVNIARVPPVDAEIDRAGIAAAPATAAQITPTTTAIQTE